MSNKNEPWEKRVSRFVSKVFNALRGLLGILKKIIQQAMRTVIIFFTYLLDILTDPSSPCFFAMAALVIVGIITSYQWIQIGIWFGKLVGMTKLWGWTFASLGLFAGMGINVHQLSSELHKINKSLAKAYLKIGLDPEHQGDGKNLGERVKNWPSFDFRIAKKGRIISYAVETGLVAFVLLMTGLTPMSFALALVSLVMPELTVKWVKATTNTLNAANEVAAQEDEDDQPMGKGRGGAGGFDGMPMGKPGRSQEI